MTRERIATGKWGEEQAANFLIQKGYRIIGKNIRTPHGEIDLVATFAEQLIFVEVRTRTSAWLGFPEESINPRKQAHMLACADYYAQQNELDTWQIDMIAVEGKPGFQAKITHFENILG
jgi:putative endonuclease